MNMRIILYFSLSISVKNCAGSAGKRLPVRGAVRGKNATNPLGDWPVRAVRANRLAPAHEKTFILSSHQSPPRASAWGAISPHSAQCLSRRNV